MPVTCDTGATHQMTCCPANRGAGHVHSKQTIKIANGAGIKNATEGQILWPTTTSTGHFYCVEDYGFFSTQLTLNLLAPIPLVDKGYGLTLTPWGKSATLTTPEGHCIQMLHTGNKWHLPPPPPSPPPATYAAPITTPGCVLYTPGELLLKRELVWLYWHKVLLHACLRMMHCMGIKHPNLPNFPAKVP